MFMLLHKCVQTVPIHTYLILLHFNQKKRKQKKKEDKRKVKTRGPIKALYRLPEPLKRLDILCSEGEIKKDFNIICIIIFKIYSMFLKEKKLKAEVDDKCTD